MAQDGTIQIEVLFRGGVILPALPIGTGKIIVTNRNND